MVSCLSCGSNGWVNWKNVTSAISSVTGSILKKKSRKCLNMRVCVRVCVCVFTGPPRGLAGPRAKTKTDT